MLKFGEKGYICNYMDNSIQSQAIRAGAEQAMVDSEFRALLQAYTASRHRKKVEIIERAYRFAAAAHRGVRRRSGEPYILHPIAVARIVISELGLGSTSICAALLHDVVEDTEYTREDIETNFGPKIAGIVEGLTKISGGIFGDRASMQAENFRKLLLSMSTDIRVILIKMADRLHNMRTLSALRPEKQFKIAGETLYVYAPLAHRLGLFKIKTELEDLAFQYEHPQKYAEIKEKLAAGEAHRLDIVEQFVAPVRQRLDEAGFKYEIKARVKSAYSIFNKMEKKKIPFDEIYDIYALRVIFENEDEEKERVRCWEIYTFFSDGYAVHPDRLRDWTSVPKANGYRALHLTAMGPDGRWIEVQIRSRRMDDIAELGYAAHWKYKTGVSDDETELDKWMNTVKDILANPEPDAIDFLDTIKLNLFASEIYVFTPHGDLRTLAAGATVLDLAFDIHTELGSHCIAGKINHRLVPLSHRLDSGDQVEIITSKAQTPKREWLGFVHTAKARNALRNLLKRDKGAMLESGRKLFADFLERKGIPLTDSLMERVLRNYRLATADDLYMLLARDEISLSPDRLKEADRKRSSMMKRLLRNPFRQKYRTAPCCSPLPGDDVVGFKDTDGRVYLHKTSCPVAIKLSSGQGSDIVAADWQAGNSTFPARIRLEGIDRTGIIADIGSTLSERLDTGISHLQIDVSAEVFECTLTVNVDSSASLEKIITCLKEIKGIKIARRIS